MTFEKTWKEKKNSKSKEKRTLKNVVKFSLVLKDALNFQRLTLVIVLSVIQTLTQIFSNQKLMRSCAFVPTPQPFLPAFILYLLSTILDLSLSRHLSSFFAVWGGFLGWTLLLLASSKLLHLTLLANLPPRPETLFLWTFFIWAFEWVGEGVWVGLKEEYGVYCVNLLKKGWLFGIFWLRRSMDFIVLI